ncbi:conserved hypothetical protein [Leishmania mexicana MHOM/GT/2001/U1103]|uniref:PPIase cyclophilin-type domain-containing protein n=1 Tax=Leishmania mexicana (strain MHOM/GT/2001/U1103) TaxID=929439 RepID=E9AUN2_LEIMU|nr:conserved hypothetical protein [Leishmania mexicana MHOM/GT/2001/U1103]CBZ26661.1 conserved hypothetical protein [Leishmania mexicana MHOM/GT/2001/U1103]
MQVELSFIFPHALKELPVSFFVPLSSQRPHTVANLFFMCSGQLPLPAELLSALHLTEAEVAYATPDDAKAAGLLPLSDSAVVRIDKASVMEIGSSTTKSIFGGFIPDERVTLPAGTAARGQSIAATMSSLKAGTLLYGNLGMPNTHASRYYILLEPVTTPEQRHEFSDFAPLGTVTSGLAELKRAASQTAVHPRTFVPKKKVVVSGCRMQLDYTHLSSSTAAGASTTLGGLRDGTGQDAGKQRPTEPHERVAGRVRRRDDDGDEPEQADPRNALDDDGNAIGPGAAPLHSSGFFKISARFPKAVAVAVAASGAGPSLKRRRAEAFVVGDDGLPTLRTTAIAPGKQVGGDGTAVPFDFFKAQQDAFMNNIEGIKDAQLQRFNRKAGKIMKSRRAGASSSSSRRHASSEQHSSSSCSGTHATGSGAFSKTGAKKTKPKRY